MAAVGSFIGPLPVLGAALLTFAAGGVLALGAALWSGSLGRVLGNLRLIGLVLISSRSAGVSLADVQTTGRLPYALAIVIGTALQLWLATHEGWVFA
jgi:prepilin peptidase CpaA